jgi:hypothetical protein
LDFEWDYRAAWEDRLSELADYRKIQHCNVLKIQRRQWMVSAKEQLQAAGRSIMTPESRNWKAWFRMDSRGAAWDERLKELADYRKSTGTAMFLPLQKNSI